MEEIRPGDQVLIKATITGIATHCDFVHIEGRGGWPLGICKGGLEESDLSIGNPCRMRATVTLISKLAGSENPASYYIEPTGATFCSFWMEEGDFMEVAELAPEKYVGALKWWEVLWEKLKRFGLNGNADSKR